MYDDERKFTKRHWYGILFLMIVLGVIAIWQGFGQTIDTEQPGGSPDTIYPEFALAFENGEPGIVRNASFTGMLDGVYVSNYPLTYVEANGFAVYQGDIIISSNPAESGLGISPRGNYMWPDGLVPYTIDSNMAEQSRITNAIAYWELHSQVRFVERTDSNASEYPNYIRFVTSTGCASYVGMQGGAQRIFLAPACSTGNTIHEIGHALGLWHEHSRNDRDDFVDVRFENIYRGYEHNFQIQSSNGEDLGEYDYGSIMHYPSWAFSKNGEDTIVPLEDDVEIGQRTHLSEGDLAAIAEMYGFDDEPAASAYYDDYSYNGYGCFGGEHGE